jgi:cytochrome c-type biogenesis protein CcmE
MKITFKSKKPKFFIGGAVVFLVVGYLVFAGVRDTKMVYLTPSEILSKESEIYDEALRLGGIVLDGSIQYDVKTLELSFEVTDGEAEMPVKFHGIIPDTFENGIEIVVDGTYSRGGVFEATDLFPKCPSKYEPET